MNLERQFFRNTYMYIVSPAACCYWSPSPLLHLPIVTLFVRSFECLATRSANYLHFNYFMVCTIHSFYSCSFRDSFGFLFHLSKLRQLLFFRCSSLRYTYSPFSHCYCRVVTCFTSPEVNTHTGSTHWFDGFFFFSF